MRERDPEMYYCHKGKVYTSFNAFVFNEGCKIACILLFSICGVLLPFYVNGSLQRAAESIGSLFAHTSISAQAPDTTTKAGLMALARADALVAGIPPDLFVKQINQESGFSTNETSSTGAEGIAQFEPGTAAGLGIDPWNPVSALRGAAHLMARYDQKYGDYAKALAAYNGGSGNVEAAIANCGAAWLSCEPAQTQAYVQKIMSN